MKITKSALALLALVSIIGSVAYCRDISKIHTASEQLLKIKHAREILVKARSTVITITGEDYFDEEVFVLTKEKALELLDFMETTRNQELEDSLK